MFKPKHAAIVLYALLLVLAARQPATAARPTANLLVWPQFNGDAQHSGNNTAEATIAPNNVGRLARLFQVTVPSFIDGAPVYLSAVPTAQGLQDLLFATTRAGHIIALDAHIGATVWSHQYGPGDCKVNNAYEDCYTTSSPAIDPNGQFVYSYGLDGYIHKYRVGDGEELTGDGWPQLTTLKGYDEKGSSALAVATARDGTSYLYMVHAGYPGDPGDEGDYQGHVTTINLGTGAQHVFNAVCSDRVDVHFVGVPEQPDCPAVQAAIWARVGVVYSAASDRIYFTTGNGNFAPGAHNWGDTVLALNPDGIAVDGDPLDSYTPENFPELDRLDYDLGSSAPAILPVPATSAIKHLGLQIGKDGELRLLDLDNLSRQGSLGNLGGEVGPLAELPLGGAVVTAPAVWTNPQDGSTWVFVVNYRGATGLKLVVDNKGAPSLSPMWQQRGRGMSPLIANNVLYYAQNNNLRALDPVTGTELWHDTGIGPIHWQSPVVVNGVVYIADTDGRLTAYALGGVAPLAVKPQAYLPLVIR